MPLSDAQKTIAMHWYVTHLHQLPLTCPAVARELGTTSTISFCFRCMARTASLSRAYSRSRCYACSVRTAGMWCSMTPDVSDSQIR
jgi:hypothetical protein